MITVVEGWIPRQRVLGVSDLMQIHAFSVYHTMLWLTLSSCLTVNLWININISLGLTFTQTPCQLAQLITSNLSRTPTEKIELL